MGKLLISLILGTALLLLGHFVFGSGAITRFFEITSTLTDPGAVQALASDEEGANANIGTIIAFIIEIVIYYGVAAILTFGLGLFMPGKKKEEQKE